MRDFRYLMVAALFTVAACGTKDKSADTTVVAASDASDASASSGAEPTPNDISNYTLDMDKMRRLGAAMQGFAAAAKVDSTSVEALGRESNETTAQTIAKLEASPTARRVLRDAGLSAKDYVWITAAWWQAAFAEGLIASSPDAKLPEGQNPKNIEFLKAHKQELEQIAKDLGMEDK